MNARRRRVRRCPEACRCYRWEAYTSQEWFDREQEQIFSRTWAYAGFAEDLSEPGQYLSVQAGLNNIFVVMGADPAAARVSQHLPPPRHAADSQRRAGRRAALPLSRLDLQPGGTADRRAAARHGISRFRPVLHQPVSRLGRPLARPDLGPPRSRRLLARRVVRRHRAASGTAPRGAAARTEAVQHRAADRGELEDRRRELHRRLSPEAPALRHALDVRPRPNRVGLARPALRLLGAALGGLHRGRRAKVAAPADRGRAARTDRSLGTDALSGGSVSARRRTSGRCSM